MDLYGEVRAAYREFADYAATASLTFAAWATAAADDDEMIAWLGELPAVKRQPNLVFAAARHHGVPAPGPYEGLRRALLGELGAAVRQTILTHATQTNEAGRLGALLPALMAAAGDRPLALIEVGASAGLCLLPDRWSYRWTGADGEHVLGLPGAPEVLTEVSGPAPLPTRRPAVTWRRGVDLEPIDVRDDARVRWLETLVWPEQTDRLRRLRAGIELAREHPPILVRGDLRHDLDDLIEQAHRETGGGAQVVVMHSVVLMYLPEDDRRAFAADMRERVAAERCRWVSLEASGVVPGMDADAPPAHLLLGIDGETVGFADQHGRSLHWLP